MTNRLNYITVMSLFVLVLYAGELYAQGKIAGKVRDPITKQPVIGVNIIVIGTSLGDASDIDGDYAIINVPVGTYSVSASAVGWKKITKKGVVVSLNQTAQVDFDVEEESIIGQEVVVTAERNILHKEVSGSQIAISKEQITETAGVRTLQEFLSTQAGVTGSNYLNIRGGRPSETGTMVDGLTMVDARVGKSQSFIPTSAVEQVSIRAGGMNAEYGSFRSGLISVTTKTGSSEGYHGSFSFTQSPAHMKRFGPSLYDPMNNYLRPHQDPNIAFIGVDTAISRGYITAYDKQQFPSYPSFAGFISAAKSLPAGWTASLKPGETVTPVNLFLYDSWMHMVNPDFDKLNAKIRELNAQGLNVGEEITDENLKRLFEGHANKEGKYSDYNFDGGFGGPVPFIGKLLGDATFYISNTTNRSSYIQPQELDYNLSSSTLLTVKSNITNNISIKMTGLSSYQKGMNPARGADSEPANLAVETGLTGVYSGLDRGSLMPENNIPLYIGSGSNYGSAYWWYPTMLQPWIQNNYLVGLTLTHALSTKSFYEFTGSYQSTKENINPDNSTKRNKNVLAYLGPIPLTEAPYGRNIIAVGQTVDSVAGWQFDQFFGVPGVSGDRFDSKGGVFYDNSVTEQLRLKLDFASQVSKYHYIKTGVELLSINLDNKRWSYWPTQGPLSLYEYNFHVKPKTLGVYIQDEITYKNMVANVGIRMDYYSFGDLVWPTGSPWSADAFAAPSWTPTDYLSILQSGRSVIWEHWQYVNDSLVAAGKNPLLQSVVSKLVFSPRFGISFPITESAKFYFNYGHFRSLPPLSEMFMYDFRYDNTKGGIAELGNPHLAPSKTIQYELGVDYNLLDEYLIHVSGYYKDVTGEVRTLTYTPTTVGIGSYRFRTNDSYRTSQGLEVQISKTNLSWLTGWINLQYAYTTGGNTGRTGVFQDSASNVAPSAFSYTDPGRPDPVPQIKASINFRSPDSWGVILGGWNLGIMPTWKQGDLFRYNPRNVDGANNEFRWPNLFLMNMKLSKSFAVGTLRATAYININNVFDTKVFMYNYAFAAGGGSATGADYQAYMSSLHLSNYTDSYYDPIRDEAKGFYLYPGYVYTKNLTDQWGMAHNKGEVVGEDHIGDMRSPDKPHINDPNVDVFTYGNPRAIWFGFQFDF